MADTPTAASAPALKKGALVRVKRSAYEGSLEARASETPLPGYALEGPGEILLKVKRAGVCGTDLHIYKWDRWSQSRVSPPVTLGHEFVGEVVELGEGVDSCALGDLVSCESHVVCHTCTACRTNLAHVCENTRTLGIDINGGFAEYVAVPAVNAWHIPPGIPLEVAAIMEPCGNAVHTAFAGPLSGCNIAVTGCGPIGLFAIAVAKAAGATMVIASDVSPYRLELARTMKADAVIDVSREDYVARVMELTDGRGLDGVLEMSGNPQAMRSGLDALRNGGRLSLLGLPTEPFDLDWNRLLIFKGVTMQGIVGRRMYETWDQLDQLLRSGRLDLMPAITHVMPMERFDEAIGLLNEGKAGKVVLVPWGEKA